MKWLGKSSSNLLFFFHRNKVTDNAISLQFVVEHFSNLKGPTSDHGNSILMRLHHGLVGKHFRQSSDLYERSSHVFSRVEAIVINANFPGFVPLLLAVAGWFIGGRSLGSGYFKRTFQDGRAGSSGFSFQHSGGTPDASRTARSSSG